VVYGDLKEVLSRPIYSLCWAHPPDLPADEWPLSAQELVLLQASGDVKSGLSLGRL